MTIRLENGPDPRLARSAFASISERETKLQRGVTLFELMVAMVIAAILLTLAMPMFGGSGVDCDNPDARQGPLMRSKISQVIADIGQINIAARKFELTYGRYPTSLAEMGMDYLLDPWDNPYQYLVTADRKDLGPVRKDHNLKPVNRTYDIYSMGPDGETSTPFTSDIGQDDIVMANDGGYIGLACQYNGSGKN